MFNKLVCLFLLASGVLGANLPPSITKCGRKNPDFSDCMKKSLLAGLKEFENGNKDFGIPPLKPFFVPKIEITADPGKSVKLNQKYENVNFHGLTNAVIKQFSLKDDGNTCEWSAEIYSPKTRMEADYRLTGQVLLFPINGHGRCNVTTEGVTNIHKAKCEHYTKKGKQYMRLKSYTMDMSTEKCHFDFQNIMPGNEQISRELSKTINENSLEIFADVKGGFEELLSRLHENSANAIFAKIPLDEIFLN